MPDKAITIARTALCAGMVAVIGCSIAHGENGAEPVWPTRQWQTSTPEAQGMDSAALASMIDCGTTRRFDSLLIARHGRIVLDAYGTKRTSRLRRIMSAIGGKAENICSTRVFRLLTPLRT